MSTRVLYSERDNFDTVPRAASESRPRCIASGSEPNSEAGRTGTRSNKECDDDPAPAIS